MEVSTSVVVEEGEISAVSAINQVKLAVEAERRARMREISILPDRIDATLCAAAAKAYGELCSVINQRSNDATIENRLQQYIIAVSQIVEACGRRGVNMFALVREMIQTVRILPNGSELRPRPIQFLGHLIVTRNWVREILFAVLDQAYYPSLTDYVFERLLLYHESGSDNDCCRVAVPWTDLLCEACECAHPDLVHCITVHIRSNLRIWWSKVADAIRNRHNSERIDTMRALFCVRDAWYKNRCKEQIDWERVLDDNLRINETLHSIQLQQQREESERSTKRKRFDQEPSSALASAILERIPLIPPRSGST